MITATQLLQVCPWLEDNATLWAPALADGMDACDANTPVRAAMYLTQTAHESAGFKILRENMNYSAEGLVRTWPTRFYLPGHRDPNYPNASRSAVDFARQPERIANVVYGGREGNGPEDSGDGWKFRAAGFGITFRNNFAACSQVLFKDPQVLIDEPDLLQGRQMAAFSFAWFWKANGLNDSADAGDLDTNSDVLNIGRKTVAIGDAIGYSDRKNYFEKFSAVLGA